MSSYILPSQLVKKAEQQLKELMNFILGCYMLCKLVCGIVVLAM